MRRSLLTALTTLWLLLALTATSSAVGVPASWDRGMNFTSWWHDSYGADRGATFLGEVAATGANAVALNATWYQADTTANTMAPDALKTPSDDALRTGIARARARGMKVMLRPMLSTPTGAPSWQYRPANVAAWFDAYRGMVWHYADLAASAGAQSLSIGVELKGLTGSANDAQWRSLIAGVRARFGGEVLYSANWDEYQNVGWWDALDRIGIDAYFPLSNGELLTEDEAVRRWTSYTDSYGKTHNWLAEIGAVSRRFDRPVVFTELGYASGPNPFADPWSRATSYAPDAQVTALRAAFRALVDVTWFRGTYIWQWLADNTYGGVGDLDHTPRGKPAADLLTSWYSANAPAPTQTPGTVAPSAPAPAPAPAAPSAPPAPVPTPPASAPDTGAGRPPAKPIAAPTTRKRAPEVSRSIKVSKPRSKGTGEVAVRGRVKGATGSRVVVRVAKRANASAVVRTATARLSSTGRFRLTVPAAAAGSGLVLWVEATVGGDRRVRSAQVALSSAG